MVVDEQHGDMIASTHTTEEVYGWMAAIVAMLAFGSFGVPIKSDAAKSVQIDPLVFQSYKTIMCFITAWIVVWCLDLKLKFTPWGIVSGLFWVPGGVATIIGVQLAGLALTIGIANSCIVLVSFTWGIVIFQEPVHSHVQAWCAVGIMMMGLMGMSHYAHASSTTARTTTTTTTTTTDHEKDKHDHSTSSASNHRDEDVQDVVMGDTNNSMAMSSSQNARRKYVHDSSGFYQGIIEESSSSTAEDLTSKNIYSDNPQQVYCLSLTRRQVGILAAVFNGLWGGSILAPMKFNTSDLQGVDYLLSFAIGAAIVNLALWILRYLWQVYQIQSFVQAYQTLPSFHLRVMWCAGGTSGLLWSIGNLASLLSVLYLGEGVGYSACQAAMLVSGLWGIFYFQEITGRATIFKWICSACITVVGILVLSYEHHKGTQNQT